jgi:hypothetical protein
MMKTAHFKSVLLVLLAGALGVLAPIVTAADRNQKADADFERLYGELLHTYWRPSVKIHGIETTVFDYAAMKQDTDRPDSLFKRTLKALEGLDPARLGGPNEEKAFWLNAYNFGAIRLIIDHYPVDSIRSMKISLIKYPWSKYAVRIGGRGYSLQEIEKSILLKKFDDPRIVFAVSCAAVSCPDRIPEPFTAARLDAQLDAMIRTFFANPTKGLRVDRDARTVTLSWILKKDSHLFPEGKGGGLGFVASYVGKDLGQWLRTSAIEIRYFDHDWALNDIALADRPASGGDR